MLIDTFLAIGIISKGIWYVVFDRVLTTRRWIGHFYKFFFCWQSSLAPPISSLQLSYLTLLNAHKVSETSIVFILISSKLCIDHFYFTSEETDDVVTNNSSLNSLVQLHLPYCSFILVKITCNIWSTWAPPENSCSLHIRTCYQLFFEFCYLLFECLT